MISYKLGSVAFTVRIVIFSSSPRLGKCFDIYCGGTYIFINTKFLKLILLNIPALEIQRL